MKVKELIEHLTKMNPEAEAVVLFNDCRGYSDDDIITKVQNVSEGISDQSKEDLVILDAVAWKEEDVIDDNVFDNR